MRHKLFRLHHAAIVWAILFIALNTLLVQAQANPSPRFEVVSIRPIPKESAWSYRELPDGVVLSGVSTRVLIADAYGMELSTIIGGPSWMDSTKFSISAKFDISISKQLAPLAPKDRVSQILSMLRPVLEERFQLKARSDTREMNTYALVVSKAGPKFSSAPLKTGDAYSHEVEASFNGSTWTVNREPMSLFARQLSRIPEVGRNVVDQTGLKGDYKFTFTHSLKSDADVSIFTELEEQLGLKLVPTKSPVEVLVIDHIEPPSEN